MLWNWNPLFIWNLKTSSHQQEMKYWLVWHQAYWSGTKLFQYHSFELSRLFYFFYCLSIVILSIYAAANKSFKSNSPNKRACNTEMLSLLVPIESCHQCSIIGYWSYDHPWHEKYAQWVIFTFYHQPFHNTSIHAATWSLID